MTLTARDTGDSNFTPVPQGMHLARCYRVVDLGTQKTEYKGQVKHLPKIMLLFEVHGNDDDNRPIVTQKGEPMSISKNFTRSLVEKATLRKDLQTWRGREFTQAELNGFELKNVLGSWATISVIKALGNNGKEYTNIATINSVPSAMKASLPQGFNKIGLFEIENPDHEMFETFSDNLKQKIQGSPEWKSRNGERYAKEQKATANSGSGFDDMDDDVPF